MDPYPQYSSTAGVNLGTHKGNTKTRTLLWTIICSDTEQRGQNGTRKISILDDYVVPNECIDTWRYLFFESPAANGQN